MPVVVQIFDKVVDVPVVQVPQFIDVLDVAVIMQRQVVSLEQWKCLRFSSSPEFENIPVRRRDGYPQCKLCSFQEVGGDEGSFGRFFSIFRAPPGCPGVERQFSEPSMTKSSSSSRAPAQFILSTCQQPQQQQTSDPSLPPHVCLVMFHGMDSSGQQRMGARDELREAEEGAAAACTVASRAADRRHGTGALNEVSGAT